MYINFFFFFSFFPFITKVYVSSSKCALIANNDGIFQFSLVSAIHHPLQLLVHAILSNQMLIVIRLFHGTKQFRIIQNGSFSINHSEEMMCQNNPHSNSLLPLHRSCHFVRFSPGIVAGSSLFSSKGSTSPSSNYGACINEGATVAIREHGRHWRVSFRCFRKDKGQVVENILMSRYEKGKIHAYKEKYCYSDTILATYHLLQYLEYLNTIS